MTATALKTVLYRPFPGGFFMVIISPPHRKVFLYSALWGGFLFCVRPGPLIMPSNVPHIIKNPGPNKPGVFSFVQNNTYFLALAGSCLAGSAVTAGMGTNPAGTP